MTKTCFLLGLCICLICSTSAQCPDNDSISRFARYSPLPPDKKLVILTKMMEAVNHCPLDDSVHALLLNSIGIAFAGTGDFIQSIRYSNEAIQFIRQHQASKSVNIGFLISCYLNLFRVYESLHNKNECAKILDSCVKIGTRYNLVTAGYIYSLMRRAEYLYNIGDFKSSISSADRGQRLGLEYAKTEPPPFYGRQYANSCALYQVNAFIKLKDYENAMNVARSQLITNHDPKYLGTIYEQMADVEIHKNRYAIAQLYLDTAFLYENKFGSVANCKVILNNKGSFLTQSLQKYEAAIPYFIKSYQFRKPDTSPIAKDSAESVVALSNLAEAFSILKNFDLAFHYFNLAYENVAKGWNEVEFLKSLAQQTNNFEKLDYLLKLLMGKAAAYVMKYNSTQNAELLDSAIRIYTILDKSLFILKSQQSNLISKLTLRQNFHGMYENAIEACELKKDFESAFYFMERSKAILLLDQLSEERWTAQFDLQKRNQLEKQILSLSRQLESQPNSSAVYDSVKGEIFRKQEQLETIKSQIKANNPIYYQYSMDTTSFRIVDVQQNLLKNHDAFFEIFSGDSAVYGMMILRNKVELKKIRKCTYDSLSNSFIRFAANSDITIDSFNLYTSISSQLYHLVFDQFSLPGGRIIISPDGKYFPFEALATSTSLHGPKYFVEDHAVSYAYSARYLVLSFNTNSYSSSKNFMGMAPVQFVSSFQLGALRGSDESIKRLSSGFSLADAYIGINATRGKFLENFYRYKLLQLYTHATDSGYDAEPVIFFADSALMLSDLLYERQPATQLIVLSGCETGAGKLYEGEGVFSFNRGFAAIGIPSCVANLWQVENTSTYQLTELFYAKLAKGLPLDVALQEAKKEFIKIASREKQLPYYWAAPILTGRTDAIELKKNYTWIYVTAGLSILVFVVVVVILPRLRRNARSV